MEISEIKTINEFRLKIKENIFNLRKSSENNNHLEKPKQSNI